jgi:hypothetical protein
VVPISVVEQPDWERKILHVKLTKEQLEKSPDVDTKKPVSRQQEIAMEEYWGKIAYWVASQLEEGYSDSGRKKYPVRTQEDPDLRGALNLIDYKVWASDGEVGLLEGFIVDDASWHIGYLDVRAGNWLGDRSVLVPTRWVKSVSWAHFRVNLHHSREGI